MLWLYHGHLVWKYWIFQFQKLHLCIYTFPKNWTTTSCRLHWVSCMTGVILIFLKIKPKITTAVTWEKRQGMMSQNENARSPKCHTLLLCLISIIWHVEIKNPNPIHVLLVLLAYLSLSVWRVFLGNKRHKHLRDSLEFSVKEILIYSSLW